MSSAALAMLAPESKSTATKTSSKALKVSEPGDAHEREADQVADIVVAGGRVPHWSLAASGAGHIQRDTDTAAALPAKPPVRMIGDSQDPPAANNYGDMLTKLAEAFLKTEAGKAIANYIEDRPIVKAAKDFVETPAGVVVAGSTAIAAIGGLAAVGKGLPAQLPSIPLDRLLPGLSVKIDVEGPLNHPTQGSLMFTFGAAPPKKKKGGPTESEKYRAETARMAQAMKFGAGVNPGRLGPVPAADAQQRQAEAKAVESFELRRMRAILQPGATYKPGQYTPLVPGTQPKSLRMRDDAPLSDPSKKEEIPVQRKAESGLDSLLANATSDVESVINSSSGRPLDPKTRNTMESRIGFDFGKVRIHTDARAAASAKALGARAYTVGNNIVFASGRFAPQTTAGRRLLAHELTHVVQQNPALRSRSADPVRVTPAPAQIQRDLEEDSKALSPKDILSPREALRKISAKIPGYALFTVIIAYDPIQGKPVDRNAKNLIGEFLKLVGASDTYDNLVKSGALNDAFEWLKREIDALQFSIQMFEDLADQAFKTAKSEILHGFGAMLKSVYAVFDPPFQRVKTFAGNVLKKVGEYVFEGALKLVNGTGVLDILRRAGAAFSAVIKDPIGFAGNLAAALKRGFNQFTDKIVDHFQAGVLNWLFGALGNIRIPKEITFGSVFNLVLETLGLDYKSIRPRIVKALGGDETVVSGVEKSLPILRTLHEHGFGAAWKEIVAEAGNLLDSILSAAKDWAINTVVKISVAKLITLFNPAGAVIEAIQAIYATLKVFVEKIKEIRDIVDAIVSSIAKIAAGEIATAADFIEGVMAKSIPLMISFLADYLHLGDVAATVREIIQKLKGKIGAGIDKVLNAIVSKAKDFIAKGIATGKEVVAKVLDWWKQKKEVDEGGEHHTIYMEGNEDQPHLMIASVPGIPWTQYLEEKGKTATPAQKSAIDEIKAKAVELEKRLPPSKNEDEKAKNVEAKRALFEEVAAKIIALGLHHDVTDPASPIHYGPVRGSDDGGTVANAPVLAPKHDQGTEPNDNPRIWTSLGSLVQKKSYVQGHLINHNLGGKGRRFNLSPINSTANSEHLNKIEKTVKKAVNTDLKVVSYKVEVVYGSHPAKPKRMQELETAMASRKLEPGEEIELKEFRAEQQLCTGFHFEMSELEHNGTAWVPKKGVAPTIGDVENKIEV